MLTTFSLALTSHTQKLFLSCSPDRHGDLKFQMLLKLRGSFEFETSLGNIVRLYPKGEGRGDSIEESETGEFRANLGYKGDEGYPLPSQISFTELQGRKVLVGVSGS